MGVEISDDESLKAPTSMPGEALAGLVEAVDDPGQSVLDGVVALRHQVAGMRAALFVGIERLWLGLKRLSLLELWLWFQLLLAVKERLWLGLGTMPIVLPVWNQGKLSRTVLESTLF